jgi:ankyrin repeat protein
MALLLLDFPGRLNISGPNYAAALESAVIADQEAVVQSLIDRGCDVNGKGLKFDSPLHAALAHQEVDIARLLVAKSARFNGADLINACAKGNASCNQNHP